MPANRVPYSRLVLAVADASGVPVDDVRRVLTATARLLVQLVGFGHTVSLPGIGCFFQGRLGLRRLNGETFGPFKTLRFRAAKQVRDRVTGLQPSRDERWWA